MFILPVAIAVKNRYREGALIRETHTLCSKGWLLICCVLLVRNGFCFHAVNRKPVQRGVRQVPLHEHLWRVAESERPCVTLGHGGGNVTSHGPPGVSRPRSHPGRQQGGIYPLCAQLLIFRAGFHSGLAGVRHPRQ